MTALGLPALYVPLPVGNGEQRLNAADVIGAGGGRMVADADLGPGDIIDFTRVLTDPGEYEAMSRAAAATGVRDGAARLAELIRSTSTNHLSRSAA